MNASESEALWRLIKVLAANQLALIQAGGMARDKEIANFCYELASERGKFVRDLAASTPRPSGVEQSRSVTSAAQQQTLRLRSALDCDDSYALVGELIRAEDALLAYYKETLLTIDDASVEELVSQMRTIYDRRAALERLRKCHLPSDLGGDQRFGAKFGNGDYHVPGER